MTEVPATVTENPLPAPQDSPVMAATPAVDGAGEDPRLRIIEAQQAEIEGLRRQLGQRETESSAARRAAETAQQTAAGAAQEAVTLRRGLEAAAASVRRLLLAAAPEVPEELVQGATPEEVEQSYGRAVALVERIKAQLQAQSQAGRLPAGAPPRRPPDLASLSPQEKIALALQRPG